MSQDVGVAYIFFKYNQRDHQDTTSILASILKELVQASSLLSEDLRASFESRHHGQSRLRRTDILRILGQYFQSYSRVYIVVDALDECSDSEQTRNDVIAQLLDLQLQCSMGLLFTSRFIPEIVSKFDSFPCLNIRATNEDVRRFTESKIAKLSPWIGRDPTLSSLIVSEILSSVNGMCVSHTILISREVTKFYLIGSFLRNYTWILCKERARKRL